MQKKYEPLTKGHTLQNSAKNLAKKFFETEMSCLSCSRLDRTHLRRYQEYSEREILRSQTTPSLPESDSHSPIPPDQVSRD